MRIYPQNLAAAHAHRAGQTGRGVTYVYICGLVRSPFPGLVLTSGVQHLTFALWAKRYFAQSCNEMNIQMICQAL